MRISWQPELLFADGTFHSNYAVETSQDGTILFVGPRGQASRDAEVRRLTHRALLPGFIDVHSHSFQRALRGKAETRRRSGPDFWSWRNLMYRCALALSPEEIYDVARMAFLEMALAGITTVGEFHYLHRTSSGDRYANPNLLAEQVMRAAQSVGIRIVLLRCAYMRAGFNLPSDSGQIRFVETDVERFLDEAEDLLSIVAAMPPTISFGVAPHSLRAVPLTSLQTLTGWAQTRKLPLHMHVAEQPAEIDACRAEYGATPFEVLESAGVLDENFTAIHAIHLQPGEIARMARARITVGACPTTERNLGDGILPADKLLQAGVVIAFGTDSHIQTDALENVRELESNLRLSHLKRAVLDGHGGESLPRLLFDCATRTGGRSLHVDGGDLAAGRLADFFAIDLEDMAIAGSLPEELLTNLVFSMSPRAVTDVIVAGRSVIQDRHHAKEIEIRLAFTRVQQRLGALG